MKKTKSTLIVSALSMLLSIAMLMGTTFAWFTDSASTGVNKIQAGNLDIQILKENGTEAETLNWVTIGNKAQNEILWEPGASYKLEPFKIKNNGSLALKYKFVITGITGDAELLNAIDFTYEIAAAGVSEAGAAAGAAATMAAFDISAEHALAAGAETSLITITGKMKETAGNEYQGLSIDGISIGVVATQDDVEIDSFDSDYDAEAPLDFVAIDSAEELTALLADTPAGEDVNISLNTDVPLETFYLLSTEDGKNNTAALGNIVVQANGHEISTNKTNTSRAVRIEFSEVERDITIIGAKLTTNNTTPVYNEDRGVSIFDLHNATINLKNCVIECKAPQYTAGVRIINCSNLTVNIENCEITASNPVSLTNTTNSTINVTNCVLTSNYEGTSAYLAHCIYAAADVTGNIFNVKNNTYNGTYAEPYMEYVKPTFNTFNDLGGNVDNTEKLYRN